MRTTCHEAKPSTDIADLLRLGLGLALYRAKARKVSSGGGPEENTESNFGLPIGLEARYPRKSWYFAAVNRQF